jgi:hypothetical protein
MAVLLAIILIATLIRMPKGLPNGIKNTRFRDVFSTSPHVNRLSLARVFLFGARDVWFVVGIPIFYYAVLSDGSEAGNRLAFFSIGSFMAVWTILYGFVQAQAPKMLRNLGDDTAHFVSVTGFWVKILTAIPPCVA